MFSEVFFKAGDIFCLQNFCCCFANSSLFCLLLKKFDKIYFILLTAFTIGIQFKDIATHIITRSLPL